MSRLDVLLKDFYQSESLSQQQLEIIKKISINNNLESTKESESSSYYQKQRQYKKQQHKKQRQHKQSSWLQQCAIAVVAFFILSVVTAYYFNVEHKKHLLIHEIALNHHKPFKADVIDSNFMTVSHSLNKVDFDITIPKDIQNQFTLVGARYCTISQQLAIHLQLLDKETAQKSSLFITPSAKNFRHIENDTEFKNQKDAHYWSHDYLFYALLKGDII